VFSIWHGGVIYSGTVYGLSGATDSTGMTNPHWWTSTIAFTVIIHIVALKLLMEV